MVVPTKTQSAVPRSGRTEGGTEESQSPANLKVFGRFWLSSARVMVLTENRKTVQSFYAVAAVLRSEGMS